MSLLIENLELTLSKKLIVRDVSLNVEPGEVVGLLGPNGAGKTSTFNMIVGLMKPDFGNIYLDDNSILKSSMSNRVNLGIGYLAQEPSIFRNLTVKENLDIALSHSGVAKSLRRKRREELIDRFNLAYFVDRFGYQLSGGERRRCEVARAIAVGRTGPKYLLLDEPFAGIDPIAIYDIQNLIATLRENGMGLLITDHNVRETLAITNRAFIIADGRILHSGSSKEVSNDPIVKKYYLGENFKL